MSSDDERKANAALVNKFMEELQKKPSPLLKAWLAAQATKDPKARDDERSRVLKQFGYEKLSIETVEKLLNARPDDVTKIQPPSPSDLTDKKDERIADFPWSVFAGMYKITSLNYPPGMSRITVDRTGNIRWGVSFENSAKATAETVITPDISTYWVTWGDKKSEWFSLQFFGASENHKQNSFKGFRHAKNAVDPRGDPFDGEWVEPSSDDPAWIWEIVGTSLGVICVAAGIYAYYHVQKARAQQLQAELDRARDRDQQESEAAEQELERSRQEEVRDAVDHVFRDPAEAARRDMLVNDVAREVGEIMKEEYSGNEGLQESEFKQESVRKEIQDKITTRTNLKIEQYVNSLGGSIASTAALKNVDAADIANAMKEAFRKSCEYDAVADRYSGMMGPIIEHAVMEHRDVPALETRTQSAKSSEIKLWKEAETLGKDVFKKLNDIRVEIEGDHALDAAAKKTEWEAKRDQAISDLVGDKQTAMEIAEKIEKRFEQHAERVQLEQQHKQLETEVKDPTHETKKKDAAKEVRALRRVGPA
ncbi:hypothetical protein NW762_013657 [Fusarium torreyae]|uniref:Uncharacterized protein n=1 Tax=Fusarium torreyae TaxID=1237075 RepID=A0A9W8RNS6_9HYPO|nr:hypothetical protein NW762_013657 [Fusarium torreyae]